MLTSRLSNISGQLKVTDDWALLRKMGDSNLDIKQREAACKEICGRYQKSIVSALSSRFCDPVLSLESWNQSMIKFWNNEVNFNNQGSAFNLIFTIAVNHGTSQLRKIKCRVPLNHGHSELENIRSNTDTFGDLELANEKITKFRNALKELSPRQREIIESVYLKGMKYKECSELLQIPIGTVMSTIFKAKQVIKSKVAA